MTRGFWESLPLPIIGLAPMDGVTDAAYRFIMAKYGKPAVNITEFTAAEGIRAGAERLLDDFLYSEIERPVVAQIFGADPSAFRVAAAVAAALGFDGIDINMGCPAKNITDRGAGAALIRDPERATRIIQEARAGMTAWAKGASLQELGVPANLIAAIETRKPNEGRRLLPISVKTRLGVDSIVIGEWVKTLLEQELAALTIHGRTLKQLYSGEANWDAIASVAPLIHEAGTLALGNGDVHSLDDAHQKCQTYGVDGVLVGRATFGNPWFFTNTTATLEERLNIALEHARTLYQLFEGRGFIRIRKHLLDYTKGFDGAKELRMQLMRTNTLAEIEELLLH